MAKANAGKFSWKKGDVKVYKNEAEWKKSTKKKPSKKGK